MLVSDPASFPHCDNTKRNGTDNAFSGSLRYTHASFPFWSDDFSIVFPRGEKSMSTPLDAAGHTQRWCFWSQIFAR